MAETTKTPPTKALGRYAMQRVHILDWLKPRQPKTPRQNNMKVASSTDSSTQKQESSQNSMSEEDTHTENSEEKQGDSASAEFEKKPGGEHERKLEAVVKESHVILVKAHSVFPLQLFPDSINVDRHKLTIIRRQFFGIEQKVSVPLENVKNIEADLGPFFGSIIITSDLFINNTQHLNFLWRDDAKKIQKLVQGAVVAQTEGIDLNKIETKKLQSLLIDLGSGHSKSM